MGGLLQLRAPTRGTGRSDAVRAATLEDDALGRQRTPSVAQGAGGGIRTPDLFLEWEVSKKSDLATKSLRNDAPDRPERASEKGPSESPYHSTMTVARIPRSACPGTVQNAS